MDLTSFGTLGCKFEMSQAMIAQVSLWLLHGLPKLFSRKSMKKLCYKLKHSLLTLCTGAAPNMFLETPPSPCTASHRLRLQSSCLAPSFNDFCLPRAYFLTLLPRLLTTSNSRRHLKHTNKDCKAHGNHRSTDSTPAPICAEPCHGCCK